MKLTVGETVLLNSTHYRVEKLLKGGAVADAYRAAFVERPGSQVVIKLVRDDQVRRLEADEAGQVPLTSREREELLRAVEGIRQEKQVLEVLNQAEEHGWPEAANPILRWQWAQETCLTRRIVALLDGGEAGPFQPFVVQEKAPAEFKRFEINDWRDERRLVAVAWAIAESISLAHQHEFALLDFDPYLKGDRIRLQELEADGKQLFDLKIIDWNVTGGPDDMVQDMFFFGRHLYYFFLGQHLPLDQRKQPPPELDRGLPAWDKLCEGSRQILQRLLHRDPQQRYQQAGRLTDDLAWWLEVLNQAGAPNAVDYLDDRLYQARRENRHDRVLSVADLSQRLDLPSTAQQSFEQRAREAQTKLEDEIWKPISLIMAKLWTGRAYARAAEEFQEQAWTLPPDGEPARRARIYYHLALVGDLFQQARQGRDIRHEPAWLALKRACEALVKQQWNPALDAIQEAEGHYHEVANWRPVGALQKLAQAGLLLKEANNLSREAEPRLADGGRADWAEVEAKQIAILEAALAKLQEAKGKAPQEPIFGQQWQAAQERLDQRRDLLSRYQDIESLMDQGGKTLQAGRQAETDKEYETAERSYRRAIEPLQNATRELQAILEADAAQYRAAEWLKRLQPFLQESQERQQAMARQVETHRRFDNAWNQARPLLAAGSYGDAVSLLQEASDLLPGREDVRDSLAVALVGARVERLAQGYLETARQHFRLRNLDEARQVAGQALAFHGDKLSSLPGGQNLPAAVAFSPFVLRQDLDSPLKNISDWISHVGGEREKAHAAASIGDHKGLARIVNALQVYLEGKGEKLANEEENWRSKARQWRDTQRQAREDLDQLERSLPGFGVQTDEDLKSRFDAIRQVLDSLAKLPGDEINELCERAWQIWLQLVRMLPDLHQKEDRLQEGLRRPLLKNPDTVHAFENQLDRTRTGLGIERDLALAGEERWPFWLDGENAGDRLRRLASDLPSPEATDIQPVSQEQVNTWYTQITGYLEAYLSENSQEVYTLGRDRRFREALIGVQQIWAFVPGSLRPLSWKKEMEEFEGEIQTRLQAGASLREIVERLIGRDDSFTAAYEKACQVSLPTHDDVPASDLQALVDALEQTGEMEKVLHDPPQADYLANHIARCHTLSRNPLEALRGIQDSLDDQVWTLKDGLRWAAELAAETMGKELDKRVVFLQNNPKADPKPVLHLYWQVRWWRTNMGLGDWESASYEDGATDFESLRQRADEKTLRALEKARQLPEILREQVAHKLDTMTRHTDLSEAKAILDGLQTLNQGLAQMPSSEEFELPTLLEYEVIEPTLDLAALQTWGGEVKWLLEQSTTAREADVSRDELEKLGEGKIVQRVGDLAYDMQEHLQALQDAGESLHPSSKIAGQARTGTNSPPTPGFPPPAETLDLAATLESPEAQEITLPESLESKDPESPVSSLKLLRQEADLQAELIEILAQARQDHDAGLAIAALTGLYEGAEERNLLDSLSSYTLWLLAPQREMLKFTYDQLRRELRDSLGQQVSRILAEQATAVGQLQKQVLFITRAGWIAQECREAIRQGVEGQIEKMGEEKRRDEARALWKIVIEATAPWAGAAATDQQPRAKPQRQSRPAPGPDETPGPPGREAAPGCRPRLGLKRAALPPSIPAERPAPPARMAATKPRRRGERPQKPARRSE